MSEYDEPVSDQEKVIKISYYSVIWFSYFGYFVVKLSLDSLPAFHYSSRLKFDEFHDLSDFSLVFVMSLF